MKILLSILSLILIVPMGYTQNLAYNSFKSCRIYFPLLETSLKNATEKEKQFYLKQWSVLAKMYEGSELLIRYFDTKTKEVISKKVSIVLDNQKRKPRIKLVMSGAGIQNSELVTIDIYSDVLKTARLYQINCPN